MTTLDSAAPLILPRPATPRRSRRAAAPSAVPRGIAARRRLARPAAGINGEQIDTWVLQGLIWLAMAGMLAWFHSPLTQALRSLF